MSPHSVFNGDLMHMFFIIVLIIPPLGTGGVWEEVMASLSLRQLLSAAVSLTESRQAGSGTVLVGLSHCV